jgi:hypothetical protein
MNRKKSSPRKKKKTKKECMMRLLVSIFILWIVPFFGYSEALDDFLFTVQCDGFEAGSGFILHDQGESWLVSNCHVVEGDKKVVFVGMVDDSNSFDLPEKIQVASNRDAVRFRVDTPDGFSLARDCSFDEEVFAFGNSDGKGIVTKSEGKIVGKGRGKIEVTCEIIPGNSGGPVINITNEVIGLSTFIIVAPEEKNSDNSQWLSKFTMIKGTRYEGTRRFAIPLHDAKWQEVDLSTFQKESVEAKSVIDQCEKFYGIISSISYKYPIHEGNGSIISRSWIRNYNRKLRKYGYWDGKSRYIIRSSKFDSFIRTLENWLEDLSEAALKLSESVQEESEKVTVKYYQEKLLEQVNDLEDAARLLEESAADQR